MIRNIPVAAAAATERAFSQNGVLDPSFLVFALIYMAADAGRGGYKVLLQGLWLEAEAWGVSLRSAQAVSAAAFCNARQKLSDALMPQLVQEVASRCSQAAGRLGLWKGRRVHAIDGSKVSVGRGRALEEAYGGPTGAHQSQMLVMVLLDVVLKLPIAFITGCYRASERTLLLPLLEYLERGVILLLDRGFEGFETFRELENRGIDFVVRCRKKNGFRVVEQFVRSGRRQAWVTLAPPHGCEIEGATELKVRVVRVDLPKQGVAVLVTTLTEQQASAREIGDLYWRRWRIETYYAEIKARWFGGNGFHAETPGGVEQEFGARVLFTAIMTSLLIAAAAREGIPFDAISRKGAIVYLHVVLTALVLLPDSRDLDRAIRSLLSAIGRHRKPFRPGRTYPRRSYALQPKWGPLGANGTHRNGRTR